MTEDLQERAARYFAAWRARDYAAFEELMAPDAQLDSLTGAVSGREPYRGMEGLRTHFEDLDRLAAQADVQVHKYHPGQNQVVAVGTLHAEGHDGTRYDSAACWVVRFDADLRVTHVQVFANRERAFAAAGMSAADAAW